MSSGHDRNQRYRCGPNPGRWVQYVYLSEAARSTRSAECRNMLNKYMDSSVPSSRSLSRRERGEVALQAGDEVLRPTGVAFPRKYPLCFSGIDPTKWPWPEEVDGVSRACGVRGSVVRASNGMRSHSSVRLLYGFRRRCESADGMVPSSMSFRSRALIHT